MKDKKKIRLSILLIIEAILLFLGSFFIFGIEKKAAESQKKEESLQCIKFVESMTSETDSRIYEDSRTFSHLLQAEMDSLAYASEHVPDFEITDSIRNSFSSGQILINPSEDSSRTYVSSTAKDGTVYALDITDYDDSWYSLDIIQIPEILFPQLFEDDDLCFVLDNEGTIISYPKNPDFKGQNISKLGIKSSQIVPDDGVWLKIDGQDYFTVASKDDLLSYTYVAAINAKGFNADNNIVSSIICASIGIFITLLILYAYYSKQDEEREMELSGNSNPEKQKNMWVMGVIAVIAITVITYQIQSLFSLSMFNIVKESESLLLESWIDIDKNSFEDAIAHQNYVNDLATDNIASLLSSYPELQTTEHINRLADIYAVTFIKLFDADMNEIATTPISQEEFDSYGEEIYDFNPLIPIVPIQDFLESEGRFATSTTSGISNPDLTGANTVTIGFDVFRYLLSISNLDAYKMMRVLSQPGDLEIIVVDSESKSVMYSSLDNHEGIPMDRIGMNESSLQNKLLDIIMINGDKYYSVSTNLNHYTVFLMEPEEMMFDKRTDIIIAAIVFSSLCTLLFLILLKRFDVSPLKQSNRIRKHLPFITSDDTDTWQDKDAEEKTAIIARIVLNTFVIIVLGIIAFRSALTRNTTIFGFIVRGRWQKGLNLYAVTAVVITFLIYSFVMNIIRYLFTKLLAIVSPKSETILRLVRSFIIYLSTITLIFYSLYLLGMDSKSLLASAGILGFIISWGSQDLLTDILSGLFIIFEKQFQVSDIIEFDGRRGTVKEIGIRTTKIVTSSGDILNISNRYLSKTLNKTQTTSSICITLYVN